MKKFTKSFFTVLFLTLVSVSLVITTGCDEDDDSDADPIIGTWTLHELNTPAGTFNTTVLSTLGYSMTVVINADNTYSANGTVFDMVINETGTWTRQDANNVVITNSDGDQTLTKSGDYYTADFGDGVTGKFKKQ